jgi:hypothetical protein
LNPDQVFDHIKITIQGSMKEVSDLAGYIHGPGWLTSKTSGFERADPDVSTTVSDWIVDEYPDRQPVVYKYPLDFTEEV